MSNTANLVALLDSTVSSSLGAQAGVINCTIKVTEELLEPLSMLDAAEIVAPTYNLSGSTKNTSDINQDVGNEIDIEIIKAKAPFKVALNFDDLLSLKKAFYEVPQEFYIINERIYSGRDKVNPKLLAYKNIANFVKLLIDLCDHKNNQSDDIRSVVFLHKNRLEIKTHYQESDILLPLDGLAIIEDLFSNNEHLDQKTSIFKETLSTFLSPVKSESDRLTYLLQHFSGFSKEFNENYHLFVSDFSFEKVRCEYEESKRKYLVDLNNVLSSVQSKMLGIPVALAVAAFKLNSIVSFENFISSSLILIAVSCYWLMMKVLIQNQVHSLDSLKEEFGQQMSRFQKQYPNQFKEIGEINETLNNRHEEQLESLRIFGKINHLMFGIVIIIFLYSVPWANIFEWYFLTTNNSAFFILKYFHQLIH